MFQKNLNQRLNSRIHRQASVDTFSKMAKVTVVHTGGLYDLELAGGETINNMTTLTSLKFYVDQWVTIEFLGGSWSIVGDGAQRGGG